MAEAKPVNEERAANLNEAGSQHDLRDIAATLAGDQAAYAALVRRYEQRVANQMWRFTRDRGTLEELVQEVFVQAYFSLNGYKGRAPFLHWLRRIATRTGYRYWQGRARERRRIDAIAEQQAELPQSTGNAAPGEAAEFLHALLERLPPKERLVLTLFYFEGCDTREIAERVGWTRTLVKVRAHRARKKLRAMLEEAGHGRSDHE